MRCTPWVRINSSSKWISLLLTPRDIAKYITEGSRPHVFLSAQLLGFRVELASVATIRYLMNLYGLGCL